MIDVRVGDQDLLERKALARHQCQEPLDFAAGIDKRCAPGDFTPDERAVLLQWRHRDDPDLQLGLGASVCHGHP